jgi:hypothetical protein
VVESVVVEVVVAGVKVRLFLVVLVVVGRELERGCLALSLRSLMRSAIAAGVFACAVASFL